MPSDSAISETKLPHGIGPHEGRELELMLSGEKPLAMFSDVVPASYDMPEAQFAPHVKSGRLVCCEETYRNPARSHPLRFVYYALPDEVWRIDAIHRINEAIHTGIRDVSAVDEQEIGQLLGYAAEEIAIYLSSLKPPPRTPSPPG